jgi:hypothetical protein
MIAALQFRKLMVNELTYQLEVTQVVIQIACKNGTRKYITDIRNPTY